jgi:hypothetical protein
MIDVMSLAGIVFSGLSALVIEDVVEDGGEAVIVRARTPGGAVACPGCRTGTGRVHGYHQRTVADVPVDDRRVVVKLRRRRSNETCSVVAASNSSTTASCSD